jgi:cytochrome b561
VRTLREIVKHYGRNSLCIDAVNFLALVLATATGITLFRYCRLIALSKFPLML